MDYRFAIGTDDPRSLTATNDGDAVVHAISILRDQHMADLRDRPQAVLTLFGPNGLVSRPSERLDEFVERLASSNPAADPNRVQPGDSNTPDCNFD